ncbi:DUF2790 domain-containing protein [Pseudomonas aeruginosa]|nr:DUF2790 domain-containing protein [Pseudomonas aeruginosa]
MTRTLLATTLLAALALPAFAAQAAAPVPTESYRYGMPLDVHKVVATQEQASTTCEIVDARMDYLGLRRQAAFAGLPQVRQRLQPGRLVRRRPEPARPVVARAVHGAPACRGSGRRPSRRS